MWIVKWLTGTVAVRGRSSACCQGEEKLCVCVCVCLTCMWWLSRQSAFVAQKCTQGPKPNTSWEWTCVCVCLSSMTGLAYQCACLALVLLFVFGKGEEQVCACLGEGTDRQAVTCCRSFSSFVSAAPLFLFPVSFCHLFVSASTCQTCPHACPALFSFPLICRCSAKVNEKFSWAISRVSQVKM